MILQRSRWVRGPVSVEALAILCVYQPAITTPLSLIGHIRGGGRGGGVGAVRAALAGGGGGQRQGLSPTNRRQRHPRRF